MNRGCELHLKHVEGRVRDNVFEIVICSARTLNLLKYY